MALKPLIEPHTVHGAYPRRESALCFQQAVVVRKWISSGLPLGSASRDAHGSLLSEGHLLWVNLDW